MKGENIIYHILCQIKNMKIKIFKILFVMSMIITMLLSEFMAAGQRYYLDPTNNGVMLVGWQMMKVNSTFMQYYQMVDAYK